MTVQDEVVELMAETAWQAFRDSDKPAPFNQMRDALRAALSALEQAGYRLVKLRTAKPTPFDFSDC
jgi:hypothetical protein